MSKRDSFRRTFRLSDHRPDVERDVDDELSLYLELRERELIEAGRSPEEARLEARQAFGDPAAIAAEVRRMSSGRVRRWRLGELLLSVMQDVRFGLRGLGRAPVFALAAILTLALGIGANAMVFGLIEAMLLRSPAVREPDNLVAVYTTSRRGDPRSASSYPDYQDYRDRTRAFADAAAYDRWQLTLADGERAELVTAELTTENYFELLGVRAAQGRLLRASDNEPGGEFNVVVLSHALWRTRFGGETSVLGRAVRLNEMPYTVIGIAPPTFSGLRLGDSPDVWVPLRGLLALYPNIVPTLFEDRGSRWMSGLVARLADGATIERARTELRAVSDQLTLEDPDARGPRTVTVDALPRYILPAGSEQTIVQLAFVLQAVVALTLLLACANLANLLLARAAARQREMGVRAAIGAGRGRIVRQLLTESGLLAAVGAIAGLLLAAIGLRVVSGFRLPFDFDVAALEPAVNARVIAFTMAVAIGTVLLFGMLPALRACRGDLATLLRQSRTGGGPRAGRPLSALVGVQVALCVVLLTGAGLFVRTLRNHLQADLGFNATGVATLAVQPWMHRYTSERTAALIRSMETSISSLPGVVSASAGARVPVRAGGGDGAFVEVEGYVPAPDEELRVEENFVTQDYFRTLGIPVLRGREFTDRDVAGAARVAIINEEMAEAWWPDRDAIGGAFTIDGERHIVVGVVSNTAWEGLSPGGSPFVYLPALQNAERLAIGRQVTFLLRTTVRDEEQLVPLLQARLRSIDPALAIISSGTMDAELATTLAPQRAVATLLAAFGLLALILASVGIYGVVAYGVAQRRRDFGIRLALGARGDQLITLVARGVGAPLLAGAVIGTVGAVALGHTVRGMMFGVAPTDPLTLAGALAILVLAAAVATLVPARRAARTDPLEVMRAE